MLSHMETIPIDREHLKTVMKVALVFLAVFAVSIQAGEDLAINWSRVVPLRSLKQFWDNNDFPDDVRPGKNGLKSFGKIEPRIIRGFEVK
jgi:hypothetical protein